MSIPAGAANPARTLVRARLPAASHAPRRRDIDVLIGQMDNQPAWALAACARILRPLVRLALAMGVKHAPLEALLRDLLIEEARRSWEAKGVTANISQLSVTTGLSRKAVTARVRTVADGDLPRTEMSAAAKTLTLWLQLADEQPALRRLPIHAEADQPSFESVARQASRGNVHHRTILQELVRLNVAIEHESEVEISNGGFVPTADRETMLAFLSDNVRDHLLTAVSNTLSERPPMLERALYAKGLSAEDCERIHQLVRDRWDSLQVELTRELTRAVDAADGNGPGRIRIGVFTFLEPDDASGSFGTTDGQPPK
jgi:hypothetical protein